MLTGIAHKSYAAHPGIGFCQPTNNLPTIIRAVVVDQNQLKTFCHRRQNRFEAFCKQIECFCAFINGDNDRNVHFTTKEELQD